MTSLRVLDWSMNPCNSTIPNWLYSLSHLESLTLHGTLQRNLLHGAVSIAIGNLSSLVSLDLSFNQLQGSIPTPLGKLCKLKTIDLSYNEFSGEVTEIFVGFSQRKCYRLETFQSWGNHLLGHLPYELGQLKSLADFDLSDNSFSGPIPMSIGRLSSLISLDLSSNKFNGTLPQSVGCLGKLERLCISYNSLEGVVSDVHVANLTRLRHLDAGGNSLTLNASENWVPPFQVEPLILDSWKLGPQFPLWLPSQMKLVALSIANTGISDSIPTLFWSIFKLHHANLSLNQICGEISRLPNVEDQYSMIDLSSNLFNGSLPLIPPDLNWLDLSNNSFSGSIYHMLCDKGEEPNIALSYLILGHNRLSGKIPDCWKRWQSVVIIQLENNNLQGSIPSSIGQLPNLKSLHLRHNNLTRELPQISLQNCSSLLIIDLGENKLTGTIPQWMGNVSLGLIILDLRSNNFSGNVPYELCHLSSFQILDVAHNHLFGPVPRCFGNFGVMAKISNSSYSSYSTYQSYSMYASNRPVRLLEFLDNAFLVTKGRDVEYRTTLRLVTSMDHFGNSLSGEIPEDLTKLVGLWSLNLSGNHLTRKIPTNIGDMRQLESLDFSLNQLSGEIPSSMSGLTFLSHLNLSFNNLTGTIPSSTQLQSMNESSFYGNNLCGPPLTSCNPNKTLPPKVDQQANEEEEGKGFSEAFFASMALGFAVGFWIVLGPILFKRSWRITYFRALEDIWHKLCDFIFECRYIFCR